MNSILITTEFQQQDSISNPTIQQDSSYNNSNVSSIQMQDTASHTHRADTIVEKIIPIANIRDSVPKNISTQKAIKAELKDEKGELNIQDAVQLKAKEDSVPEKSSIDFERFGLFKEINNQRFAVKPGAILHTEQNRTSHVNGKMEQIIHHSHLSYLNWTLLVGLLCVILLLSLKSYYKKFTSRIVNTLVNFQLADKMLREKNIIVRRAFFIMNLNFVMVLGLFILLLTIYWEFRITESYTLDYFLILAIIIGILLVRLFFYYLAGYLFDRLPSVIEHIHMVYLVNKNLGLVLLPIAFIAIYTSNKISVVLLYAGIIILAIATVYKLIRGFQIIFRSGVLLFYAILYLCTLELLPLLVGSKIIILLR